MNYIVAFQTYPGTCWPVSTLYDSRMGELLLLCGASRVLMQIRKDPEKEDDISNLKPIIVLNTELT